MLTLRYALLLFVGYFLAFALYYRFYFRPRIYLLLLTERSYLEHYIGLLPHMADRPEDRQGMVDFLQGKRRAFLGCLRRFVGGATLLYLVLLYFGASA